ncbi:MAG: iron uptake porin [Aphanizomenon flos-aquae KM1D3_PB]|uniref:iron uptake porin n=1 Tax=Aphanizomenon flos-aquae TaxID=1176 RepID=UPI000541B76F|nr:iron uptake porin [Aphanizomenon flos-aquae]KHG41702.1 membrane protein [Aphanizomenon flos-aquae 2012/KM1/D3]QSV71550.1 MAG: iron uptake porin [Aphanizomenon flos-aquae KM1D3_PB]
MSTLLRNSLWMTPLLIAVNTMTAKAGAVDSKITNLPMNDGIVAETQISAPISNQDANQEIEQVTSVSQLSDVQPTDWAFQALQSLVERYDCIAGYPNNSFRGNRAMTRYEFAAGLNTCLNRVQELIATSTADMVKKEDLEILEKLQQEFADGLVEIRGRIDGLENRTAVLEGQQFSPTTKLSGEVIFSLGGVFGGDRALDSDRWRTINAAPAASREAVKDAQYTASGGRKLQDNTIFSDRVRLIFDTSFSGKDRLRLILKANNTIAFNSAVSGTQMTRLGWDTTVSADNTVEVGKLFYNFPVGDKLNVTVDAIGGSFFDNFNTVNPLFSAATVGAVSRFGRFAPIYRASNTGLASGRGSGISGVFKLNDKITLSGGYLARNANDPNESRGLFDGTYGTLAQLAFQPNQNLTLALAYAHSYFSGAVAGDVSVSGAEGSVFANTPFGANIATSANHYGLQTNYRLNPQFTIGGWVGYTQAIAENSSGANVNRGDKADIWNWAVNLAFPDLGKKGNLGGIIFGQPPKVTSNDFGPAVLTSSSNRRLDSDTSLHLEALYRYQANNNLSITPGLIVIFNSEHNSNNDTIYTGLLRTTFRF